MRLHYFQHETFEGLGAIEEWAISKGFTITSTHLYLGEPLPNLEEIDWLVIMGGSMSVNDETDLPWLVAEKLFVKAAIEANKVVFGICLGAQMIANVLGSKVFPNSVKEIGWFPVKFEETAFSNPIFKNVPKELNVLHWHGETFDLPKEAILVAQSKACVNQAFVYKEKVVGLQFHLEFNEKSTDEMLKYCSHELKEDAYIQSGEKILAQNHFIPTAKKALFGILDALL